jgi:hypothetical protein
MLLDNGSAVRGQPQAATVIEPHPPPPPQQAEYDMRDALSLQKKCFIKPISVHNFNKDLKTQLFLTCSHSVFHDACKPNTRANQTKFSGRVMIIRDATHASHHHATTSAPPPGRSSHALQASPMLS